MPSAKPMVNRPFVPLSASRALARAWATALPTCGCFLEMTSDRTTLLASAPSGSPRNDAPDMARDLLKSHGVST